MIYLALANLAVIALLGFLLARTARDSEQRLIDVIASAEAERAQLLERIQRPEIPPHRPRAAAAHQPTEAPPRTDLAAYQRVGTAQPLRDPAERQTTTEA